MIERRDTQIGHRAPALTVGPYRWRVVGVLSVILSLLMGCSTQAPYMRGWQPEERILYRWTGGTFRANKLSDDEKAVMDELGTPDTIRFFRGALDRQRVYEWIYQDKAQVVWFADGQRVDYVAVDTNTSARTQAERDQTTSKVVQGGFLGGIIAGLSAGFVLLAEDIGLRN